MTCIIRHTWTKKFMSIIQQLSIVKFFLPAPGYFDFHGSSLLSLHYNPQKESMNLTTRAPSFLHCFSNGVPGEDWRFGIFYLKSKCSVQGNHFQSETYCLDTSYNLEDFKKTLLSTVLTIKEWCLCTIQLQEDTSLFKVNFGNAFF